MECKYCHKEIPDDAKYCHLCGKQQIVQPKRHRRHRPQSQGSIVKLSGGHRENPYWARLPADYSTGVAVRQSIGCFPSYASAAAALAKALYAPEEESQKKQKSLTLQDMYNRFIASNYYSQLSKSAQGSHRSAWSHMKTCADIPVERINKDTFQIIINQLQETGYKRETLAKIRNLASLLCKEAMGLNLISVNFGALVQLPKQDGVPVKPFSKQALEALWQAADMHDKDAWAVLTLVYTGMRPSELLNATIEVHLHIENDSWFFRTGSKSKAGKNRIIPIPTVLKPIISQLISGRNTGPVVAAEHGGFHRLDNWRPRHFNKLMKRLNLDGYVPYSARHTYADALKRNGTAPETVATILGHEDYATAYEHYFTTTDEDISRLCEAANKLERPK